MSKKPELTRRQAVISGMGAGACALIGLKGGLTASAAEKVLKTPGVYIREKDAFPTSVIAAATSIPAFIGYTEKAERKLTSGKESLTNKPTRISALAVYEELFGGPPPTKFKYDDDDPDTIIAVSDTQFFLYQSLQLFFNNGGGPCWIVSVGGYKDENDKLITKSAKDFGKAWAALIKEPEPAIIVVPDAVLLEKDDWKKVTTATLNHCAKMKDRFAILDVYGGYKQRTYDKKDVISQFRGSVSGEGLSYAAAYYPWLNTNLIEAQDINYTLLDEKSRKALVKKLKKEAAKLFPDNEVKLKAYNTLIEKITTDPAGEKERKATNQALKAKMHTYWQEMSKLLKAANTFPPSGAMAGVYTKTDNAVGVFKAPANTTILSVISPTVNISHDEQEDLNVSVDGKSVNAIREFIGEGVLVWGARTLDGNSLDWRYINVRRTMIMLEQSIRWAAKAYVFGPNTANTWITIKKMSENFLNGQWKVGALAGATADDAYQVNVGLGETMTAEDILDGIMRISVKVAPVHPAEFIVFTIEQQMQKS